VKASKWRLLNHLVGKAKLAVYTSRKNRVEGGAGQEALPIFTSRIRARIRLDFKFFNSTNNTQGFCEKWCYNRVVCHVAEGELLLNAPFDSK